MRFSIFHIYILYKNQARHYKISFPGGNFTQLVKEKTAVECPPCHVKNAKKKSEVKKRAHTPPNWGQQRGITRTQGRAIAQ